MILLKILLISSTGLNIFLGYIVYKFIMYAYKLDKKETELHIKLINYTKELETENKRLKTKRYMNVNNKDMKDRIIQMVIMKDL